MQDGRDVEAYVEAQLARIAARNGDLHAFALVTPELAREAAWQCARRSDGNPLAGRTLAVKDLIDVAGLPTGGGAAKAIVPEAERTAPCAQRLFDAGMIPVGKAALVELAFGTWGVNRATATPRNPWDPVVPRVAGGSSSGSAVAVAAGLADAALGTDTGGSIRIPCALNGLTGIKPTGGRVPTAGVLPLAQSLDTVGPMTWTVVEAARMLQAMADPAPENFGGGRFEAEPAIRTGLRAARVAVLGDAALGNVSDPVGAAYLEAVSVLERMGARVVEARPPIGLGDCVEPLGVLIATEAWANWGPRVERVGGAMDPGVRARLLAGSRLGDADRARALAARRREQDRFHAWLQDLTALATPTVPVTALPLADLDENRLPFSSFVRAGNWLDLPAVALPCGMDAAGLPVSLQILALPWREDLAVGVAAAYQQATGWHLRRPPEG